MINMIIALLVEAGYFTEDEGELLAPKMRQATLPADFTSAHKLLKDMLKEVKEGN